MDRSKGLPKLASLGDKTERDHWGHLRKLVPHYETFWQCYVYPLRARDSIWFREGIDGDLEGIAIASYSTFGALARARHRIFSKHEDYRFIEELYAAVQRSAEVGVKLVNQFSSFFKNVTGTRSRVVAGPLEQFKEERLGRYRNLLHDAMLAMPKDDRRRRLIPRPDYIDHYRLWTAVMYNFEREHFIPATDQVRSDFRSTCSLLEDAWKGMSDVAGALRLKPKFGEALSKGQDRPSLLAVPPASGALFLGASSAAPISARFIFPKQ
jgi:hypothetical protein